MTKWVQWNKSLKWLELSDKALILHDQKTLKIEEYILNYVRTLWTEKKTKDEKFLKCISCDSYAKIFYDKCPTESIHCQIKGLWQNTQRIKNLFEFQPASRLYEEKLLQHHMKQRKMMSQ